MAKKELIQTKDAPAAIGPYSQAIKVGNLVFCSGQIPLDPATMEIVGTDVETQTVQVLKNIKAVLQEVGVSADQIVKTTVFLKNMGEFQVFNAVYENFFKSEGVQIPPARSCVEVSELPKSVLVEVETILSV